MNRINLNLKKIFYLILILIFGFLGTKCAAPKEGLKTYPKDYVYPLTEINLEKVFSENRGLRVLAENATAVHDYYRGGVQEKEEGEGLLKEQKWKEAETHIEKSNQFLNVVVQYLSEDEAHLNIYGDQVVIFLPNLLMADNYQKLVTVYRNLDRDDKAADAMRYGEGYLSRSLKTVKTEWALHIQKGFEDELPKK